MKYVILDIETSALEAEKLAEIKPAFATRNKKDPAKVADELAEKEQEWMEKAATSPITGKVLAIGYRKEGQSYILGTGTEADDLQNFWDTIWEPHFSSWPIVGCYIKSFDLPFLVRRSFSVGVRPPRSAASRWLWDKHVHDIIEMWHLGDKYIRDYVSLDHLAWSFGVQRKNGKGSQFSGLWVSDRNAAMAYLTNDLEVTEAVYQRMAA